MGLNDLEIDFVPEGDLLCLWGGIREPVKAGDITTRTILTAFHSRRGEGMCRGFDFFDAAKTLMPILKGERSQGDLFDGELSAAYTKETDTLTLCSSRHTAICNQTVAEGLTAHCTERGWAVGFTLERAAELLLPYLETWRPWTDEEMAQIQKQMADRDEASRKHRASEQ